MADFEEDKKHAPSETRRRQAREEGRVARSHDLSSAVVLLMTILVLDWMGSTIFAVLAEGFRRQFSEPLAFSNDPHDWIYMRMRSLLGMAVGVLPILAAVFIASLATHFEQVGPLWLPSKVGLDWNRIQPNSAWQRILGGSNLVRFGFGLLKCAVVIGLVVFGFRSRWEAIFHLDEISLGLATHFLWRSGIEIARSVAIGLLIFAFVDYGIQRWMLERELRMTDEEMREELKRTQGDPQVRRERKRLQKGISADRASGSIANRPISSNVPSTLASESRSRTPIEP